MKIDILTLFPEHMNAMLHESILGRAAKKGILDINCVQIRDFTENKQNQVDDYPYGGGWGCVMMAQPLKSCVESVLYRMKNLLTYMIQNLVDHPDEVSVTEREAGNETVFEVRVADGDMGKVIGRQGRIIKEVRVLMKAVAQRKGKKVSVEVLD